jgi:hypothetical protein
MINQSKTTQLHQQKKRDSERKKIKIMKINNKTMLMKRKKSKLKSLKKNNQ